MMKMNRRPMLNLYPDSLGGTMSDVLKFLKLEALQKTFSSLYVLPSVFNTDLDRGFSVIDYNLNEVLADPEAIKGIQEMNIDFKFDMILNHASVLSEQFQDILQKGEASEYKDFFINWNQFWDGHGQMTDEGHIQPEANLIADMYFRKPGLPILEVRMPDGKKIPYWNTFYQAVHYEPVSPIELMKALHVQYLTAVKLTDAVNKSIRTNNFPNGLQLDALDRYKATVIDYVESKREYLGQMDVNVTSPLVWTFYEDTLDKLSSYGAQIVRLDAFAYASKVVGKRNFFNEPETWDILGRLNELAIKRDITLLPEIHSKYEEYIHEAISDAGYMTYDFFLPGLIIDAFERRNSDVIKRWIRTIHEKQLRTVNMLGCHDGIPLLDLKGLLTDQQIENLIETVVRRGGYVKDLHGKKNIYYQVNATYYSALGEDDKKMLLARAIQMFMPGKPQVWYLDLFCGKNDYEAMERAGEGGHKEINRTNLGWESIAAGINKDVVKEQLSLIKLRNTHPAFDDDAKCDLIDGPSHLLQIRWTCGDHQAILRADLEQLTYEIES